MLRLLIHVRCMYMMAGVTNIVRVVVRFGIWIERNE